MLTLKKENPTQTQRDRKTSSPNTKYCNSSSIENLNHRNKSTGTIVNKQPDYKNYGQ